MPSLQLDVTRPVPAPRMSALSAEMGAVYVRIMDSDPALMTVVVRTLPTGSIWLGRDPAATDAALLMCDVRLGRDRSTRMDLAAALVRVVVEHTGVPRTNVKVEFTQHSGDEMYHSFLGGFSRDWAPSDAGPIPGRPRVPGSEEGPAAASPPDIALGSGDGPPS